MAQPITERERQLISLIDLLRHAEAEILELNLKRSAVLLEAAIADLTQHLN